MVAGDGGKTLGQSVANDHVESDAVYERLHFWRYHSTRRWEDVGIVQAQLLAHHGEDGILHHIIFESQRQRRVLSTRLTFYIVLVADIDGRLYHHLLCYRSLVYLSEYGSVDLLPEARHGTHARGACLLHRLQHLVRIGIDDNGSAHRERQIVPTTFEDVGYGQERHHAVLLPYGHALRIRLQRGSILAAGEHHALRLTRSA